MKNKSSELELSRPLAVDKIPPSGLEEKITASKAERQRVAERFGLLDLSDLKAHLDVHPTHGGQVIAVTGTMTAEVVQQCVVTLESLPSHIEQNIAVRYADETEKTAANALQIEPDEDDIEPIIGGVIDLGELVAQHLGTALDPYPRKPGLAFVEAAYGDGETDNNPFAKLTELPKKTKD
jgi:uncharacterized metal-binding protein YceD (DUF177 family)